MRTSIEFRVVSCRPLGRLVPEILERLAGSPASLPSDVRLDGRRARSLAQVGQESTSLPAGWCDITMPLGKLDVHWWYGPTVFWQSVNGTLGPTAGDLDIVEALLTDLCGLAGASFAYADRRTIITHDLEALRGVDRDLTPWDQSFYGLYWFNCFGPEYRAELPVDDVALGCVHTIIDLDYGGMVVIGRAAPSDPITVEGLRPLLERWPVFEKYTPGARFLSKIELDFSPVRSIPVPPEDSGGPIWTIVGDVDEFMARAPEHAARFTQWAAERGIPLPENLTEDAVAQAIIAYADDIRADAMEVQAIAAYGEAIRQQFGGRWRKAIIFHRGEPVVQAPRFPWLCSPVVIDVVKYLEEGEDDAAERRAHAEEAADAEG